MQCYLRSYKMNRGITYFTVCAASYPRRLALCYLDEVCALFEDELTIAFGSRAVDFFAMIETIEAPYHFIKFERVLQKKRQEFADPGSSKALSRLNDSLAEVSDLMRQNIEEILQRGENLSDVGKKASDLKSASEKFKGLAKALSFRALVQQYAPLALVVLFFVTLLFWKLYL
ncbi:vesicle trafficking [Cyclospora cayetanensis]|uniref:Vesicle-trafficking protein SEC22b n=1 Tax=Cyclospora cayetanensis TaxID=88456 RepID=A0A1D3D8U5_9EIME|nr:vesicle trafficking [Cyclospora cayetanensis]